METSYLLLHPTHKNYSKLIDKKKIKFKCFPDSLFHIKMEIIHQQKTPKLEQEEVKEKKHKTL